MMKIYYSSKFEREYRKLPLAIKKIAERENRQTDKGKLVKDALLMAFVENGVFDMIAGKKVNGSTDFMVEATPHTLRNSYYKINLKSLFRHSLPNLELLVARMIAPADYLSKNDKLAIFLNEIGLTDVNVNLKCALGSKERAQR